MTSQFMCMVRGRLCLFLTAIMAITMITHLGFVALLIDQQMAANGLLERSLGSQGSTSGRLEVHLPLRQSRDLSHVTNPNLNMGTPTVRFTTPASVSHSKTLKPANFTGIKRKSSVQKQNGVKGKAVMGVNDISRNAAKTVSGPTKKVVTDSSRLRNVKIGAKELGQKDQEHVRGSGRELTLNSTNYKAVTYNRTRAGIKLLRSSTPADTTVGPKQNMIQHLKNNLKHPLVPASLHRGAAPSVITHHAAAAKDSGKKVTYLRSDTYGSSHKKPSVISKQSQAKEAVISQVAAKVGAARQVQARPSNKVVSIPKRNQTHVTTTVPVTIPSALNAHKKHTSREVMVGKLHSPGGDTRSGKSQVPIPKSAKGDQKPKMAAGRGSSVVKLTNLPQLPKVAINHLESRESHIEEYNIDKQRAVWEAADDMLDTHLILHKTTPKKKAKQRAKVTTKATVTTIKPTIKPPSVKKPVIPQANKKLQSSGHS